MKKLNFWLFTSLFVAAFAFSACSSSDSSSDGAPGGGGGSGNPDNPRNAAYYGMVVDNSGIGLSGVKVTAGTFTATTGYSGAFTLDKVSGNVLVFEKAGFAKVVRPIADNVRFDVVMTAAQSNAVSTSTPTTLNIGWNGAKVDLPTTFKDNNGNSYTGEITASSVYLDPDDETFANQMPGDLSAIRTDNSEAQLVSYGMVNVELKGANGENLQPDGDATLKFPIPERFSANPPSEIPLWEFDEATGVWKEEGVATLQGSYYVGTVTHFSWHNLDYPEARATLNVKVVDANGNVIKDLPVDFDGQREVITKTDGIASCTVPSNTSMVIQITSEAYGNYAANADGSIDKSKIVKQTVKLDPQEKKTITLKMPGRAPVIKGTVLNSGSGSNVCRVWLVYNYYQETPYVISDLDGAFTLYAPVSYRGEATLKARFGDGTIAEKTITITDDDQTVNFEVDNSSAAGAAVVQVTGPNGLNIKYQFVAPKNGATYEGAVTLNEGTLSVNIDSFSQMEDGEGQEKDQMWGSIHLQIPNYDSSKTSFTASDFQYMLEGRGWVMLNAKNVAVTVTNNGGVYNFKINNASGDLIDRDLGFDWDNKAAVKFSTEFSAK